MPPIKLSVLDMVDSLDMTIGLVAEADRLGYSRYWLTEHQPQANPQLTICTPPVTSSQAARPPARPCKAPK